ncbi:unnamed protein product [Urochloa humidicola]
MENPDLRKAMGMKPDQKGVCVMRVEPTSPASGCLQPSDIILSFDGVDIGNDGTVPFRHGERIGFSYLVSKKYTGEKALVKVMRDSEVHEFEITLATHKRLIPCHLKGRPPSYYIVAGIVFVAVSVPYLRSEFGKNFEDYTPTRLLVKHFHAMAESPDEQLVVISQVVSFNGRPVKNLKNLVTMVENCKDKFLKFDLEFGRIVILETETSKATTQDILTARCIPSAMSDDLKA